VTSKRISKAQYNQEIEAYIAQIEEGNTFTHQQVKERMEKWTKE